jgi:hypothetical protein
MIMNELINIIVQKTGISQENAQKAVQVTVDFLKSKLPGPAQRRFLKKEQVSSETGALTGCAERGRLSIPWISPLIRAVKLGVAKPLRYTLSL